MAQRKSKNRRMSGRSDISGYLDDNTNKIDNNDPYWYNRTIVRPSTSIVLTPNASSILNPDSMVADETQSSNDWYTNLSRSVSSKLNENILKSKINNQKKESKDISSVELETESESEPELRRKRTKLGSKKKVHTNDKNNTFLKALEKTLDSPSRTHLTVQTPEVYESESTNDDSKTIKRTRPGTKLVSKKKVNMNDESNTFSKALEKTTDSSSRIHSTFQMPEAYESESTNDDSKTIKRIRPVIKLVSKKKVHMNDKSNTFSKALEKTTDSSSRIHSTVQMPEAYESESTNDDSKIIKRIRPGISRNTKPSKENMNNFDDLFHSDSTIEDTLSTKRNSRSSLKGKNMQLTEHRSIPKEAQKLNKSQLQKLVETDSAVPKRSLNTSKNTTANENLVETSFKELRNRSIVALPKSTSLIKSSQKQTGSSTVYDPVDMSFTAVQNKSQKKRGTILTEKSKSGNSENVFDIVDDNSDLYNELLIERSSAKVEEQNIDEVNSDLEYDESETSTIPINIRRTRSFAPRKSSTESEDEDIFDNRNQRDHKEMNNDENEAFQQSSKHTEDDNVLQRSVKESQNTNKSHNLSKSQNKLLNNTNNTVSNKSFNEEDNRSLTGSEIFENTKTQEDLSDDETTFDKPKSSTSRNAQSKSTKENDQSQIRTSIKTLNKSKTSNKSSKIYSQKSKSAIDIDENVNEHSDIQSDNTVTPNVTNKSRSRLLRSQSRISNDENAFDNILNNENSTASEKSKITPINKQLSMSSSRSKTLQSPNEIETNSRAARKSVFKKPQNIFQVNKSATNESIHNSQQDESKDETSPMPNNKIRRSRAQLFERSKVAKNNAFDKILATGNSGANKTSESNKSQSQKLSSSQNSNSTFKRRSSLRSSNSHILKNPEEHPQAVESPTEILEENQDANKSAKNKAAKLNKPLIKNIEVLTESKLFNVKKNHKKLKTADNRTKEQTSKPLDVNIGEKATNKGVSSQHNSIKTSTDSTPKRKPNENLKHNSGKTINDDYLSDDVLHTPNPTQSTLKKTGKPFTCITQFFSRNSIANKINLSQISTSPNSDAVIPHNISKVFSLLKDSSPIMERVENNKENENVEIDSVVVSEVNEKSKIDENSYEAEKLAFENSIPMLRAKRAQANDNVSTIDESVWAKVKERTDALKIIMETEKKRQAEIQRKRELEKAQVEAHLKRKLAQQEAELKKKRKKPIDKAYYFDGKIYKQPKLPKPHRWVTERLYKYLWKVMQSKFGIRTRIQSEKFVQKLSETYNLVTKRTKYESYKENVNDLMIIMAKLGLIEHRYDFYMFCRDFMPFSFRIKVIPMLLPGNIGNIPYKPEQVYKPILS